ncbi:HAMP domain-containing protein [Dechloromonas sp. HYN0024]|uniref:sensor histidine kinase n=1 Tax=Dechloromonas sp. HYN0024 TaxID=2231055 RepID=UPI000E4452F8|nr:HAMP domain-containing protein [Dechloromonas sp. HYN0024]AXS80484.1 HAMP domain-containing protein [Dechloromonas sp. HYN0024]
MTMPVWPLSSTNRRPAPLSLHTRVGLVLTALAASLLIVLAGLWLHGTRSSIHEEVEAASRVSEQWLHAVLGEMHDVPAAQRGERLVGVARAIGRVRANAMEVRTVAGDTIYRSPGPTYKAGRTVPEWFAGMLASELPPRTIAIQGYTLILHPDDSRAVIDAWDDLLAMAGWALALLGLIFVATRSALGRALHPLAQIMRALDRTGRGRFDTRLPVFPTPELGRISRAFNGMADRLGEAVDENVRLESAREVDRRMQAGLEDERRIIARELHDELAQGITAVRALAGAIVQRTSDAPALHIPAQGIVAVTGEMQDGVRNILQRLRPVAGNGVVTTLERLLASWQKQHPEIRLNSHLVLGALPVADDLALTVVRIVQEGLTNIIRHADASQVDLAIRRDAGWLQLTLVDNGRGRSGQPSVQAGCGLGLAGMGERIALLGGHLQFEQPDGGGFGLVARLPDSLPQHSPEEFA